MTTIARLGLLDLLDQDRVWLARRDGDQLVEQRIDDMDQHHQAAALALLRGHAAMLQQGRLCDLYRAWQRDGDQRQAIEREMAWVRRQQPARWLEDQPLVLALARLAPRPVPTERRRRVRRLGAGGCN